MSSYIRPDLESMISSDAFRLILQALRQVSEIDYGEVTLIVKRGKIRFVQVKTATTVEEDPRD